MSSVTIQNVTKSFGNTVVLENFDAVFQNGEFITLLGPSGCGKTTMLRIIAGFEKPTSGCVKFDDRVVSSDKVFIPPEKRDIGMVFQSYAVWPHMTVFDNVAYPLQIKKVDKATIKKKVDRVLEVVHLTQYRDRIPSQLSGGQQQRVALARALVAEPALLLLDEPLSNLDARLRLEMREEIRRIQLQTQVTTIFVTHDQEEAMSISDMIVVMKLGVVQQIGKPQDVYDDPANLFVAKFLGTPPINVFKGRVEGGWLYLDNERVLSVGAVPDQDVMVGIRPEGFIIDPNGPMHCKISSVEVMGRDVSVVSTHPALVSPSIRSIVDADNKIDPAQQTIAYRIKPHKLFIFDSENEERIPFEVK